MSKLGKRLITAATEANAIARGEADPTTYKVHVPAKVDVQAIRKGLNLSQDAFGVTYHIPAATVRDWEQNRREPDTASRAYLTVIERAPAVVAAALRNQEMAHLAQKAAAQAVRTANRGLTASRKTVGKRSMAAKR